MRTRARSDPAKQKRLQQINKLLGHGWTHKLIAEKLGVHEATVRRTIAWGRERAYRLGGHEEAEDELGPEPKYYDELSPEIQELVQWDPLAFEQFFLRYNGRYDYMPDHQREVAELVFSNEATVVTIPPRHAKSEFWSVWFPMFLVARDRNIQVIIVSKTHPQAMKFARKISLVLARNKQLITDFGRFKPNSTDIPWRPGMGELVVEGRKVLEESGDLTLQVRGAGQGILGMAANVIVGDDVANPENSSKELQRDELFGWFYGEVLSRMEPGLDPISKEVFPPRAVVLGTRFHAQDLYGALPRATYEDEDFKVPVSVWKSVSFPAIQDWDKKEVLWPQRFSFKHFMRLRAHDPSIFEAMYQQNPLSVGSVLARPEWINGEDDYPGCLDTTRSAGEGLRARVEGEYYGEKGFVPVIRVMSIDPSPTMYAGITVADIPYISPANVYRDFYAALIEAKREKMGPREMVAEIERVHNTYGPIDYLIFEKSVFARWFLQDPAMRVWMRKMRIIPHETTSNKGDPDYGIMSLAGDFEMGRISIPWADSSSRFMFQPFIDEATSYPQGRFDDMLMSMWFIKFQHRNLLPLRALPRSQPRGMGNRELPPRLRRGYSWQQKRSD